MDPMKFELYKKRQRIEKDEIDEIIDEIEAEIAKIKVKQNGTRT